MPPRPSVSVILSMLSYARILAPPPGLGCEPFSWSPLLWPLPLRALPTFTPTHYALFSGCNMHYHSHIWGVSLHSFSMSQVKWHVQDIPGTQEWKSVSSVRSLPVHTLPTEALISLYKALCLWVCILGLNTYSRWARRVTFHLQW